MERREASLSQILLVPEVTEHIMSFLTLKLIDIFVLRRVCRHWKYTIEQYTFDVTLKPQDCPSVERVLRLLPLTFRRVTSLHVEDFNEENVHLYSTVSQMTNLKHLSVAFPRLNQLESLGKLTSLVSLQISGQNCFAYHQNLTRLQRLSIVGSDNNYLPDFSRLTSLVNLTYLNLHGCAPNVSTICATFPRLKHFDIGRRGRWGHQRGVNLDPTPILTLSSLEYLDLSNINLQQWAKGLSFSSLTNLQTLIIPGLNFAQAPNFLDELTQLKSLTHLRTSHTSAALFALRELRVLICDQPLGVYSNSNPFSLHNLSDLNKLEKLSLVNNTVASLSVLNELTTLTHLNMDSTHIDAEGFRISNLKNLRFLNMSGSNCCLSTRSNFLGKQLQFLTKLEDLNLSNTSFGDEGMTLLGPLSFLRKLDVSGTCITEDSVPILSQMTYLEELAIKRLEAFSAFSRLATTLNKTIVKL